MTLTDLDRDLTARRATLNATAASGEWTVTLTGACPQRHVTRCADTLLVAVELAFVEWDAT
jgi:hypothetical protein